MPLSQLEAVPTESQLVPLEVHQQFPQSGPVSMFVAKRTVSIAEVLDRIATVRSKRQVKLSSQIHPCSMEPLRRFDEVMGI